MNFNNFRRYSISIPALVITIFLFSFAHSELGLFNYDHGNHSEHDHCEIVQVTDLTVNSFKLTHAKLEVNKHLTGSFDLPGCFSGTTYPVALQNNLNVVLRSPLPVYISHRSLLI